ncbi:high mobility group B protein 6-like isoform X2 [Populus nigra]|uniref:high mobility group B protein 6-like isoform X2 n=1 Tax=Populus nigra TaxID=3691 RepID=UPI002B269562|nr:high mobility group B protein 6-like isoform X2 [Populus nigra]
MLKLQSPLTGDENLRPKSCRKPLQPKNSPGTPMTQVQILKPKQEWIEFSVVKDSNKENHPIYTTTPTKSIIEPLDSSLAEELSAIKKKLERLRLDRERTEKMLKEREMVMDLQMKELEQRGEVQRRLEIQVDILYRLNELQSYSMIISPIRTLREKEHEKKTSRVQPEETRAEDSEESVGEDVMQSPSSSWGSENSISSQLVAVK